MEARGLPIGAVGVAHVIRAFVPGFENGQGVGGVLHDHEAGISVGAVEAIRIELGRLWVPGVFGHGDGVGGLDVPVVQHPLNGHVQEAEGGIGVEEDNKLVLLDVVCERRGLDPGGVAVLKVGGLDELVVVAVDGGVCVVVEDAARDVVDVTPVVFALAEGLGRLQVACLEVEDEDLAAERLLVARVRGQLDVAAIGLADEWLGRRGQQRGKEGAQDVIDGRGRLFCVDRTVLVSR